MTSQLIAQTIGFTALAFSILAYQSNKRRLILGTKTVAFALFVIHFSMLGAYTGAAMNLLGGVRTHIFNQRLKKQWADKKGWLYGFLAAVWLASALTWDGPISILPAIGASLATIAFWMKDPKHLRYLSYGLVPTWFAYNYSVGSYAGMLADTLLFVSLLVATYRFDLRGEEERRKKKITQEQSKG